MDWTGDGQLQGQGAGCGAVPRCADLCWTGLEIVGVGEESGENRRDERSMQQCLQGAGPFGVDRVQAMHRLVQLDAEFHLPAHAVEGQPPAVGRPAAGGS